MMKIAEEILELVSSDAPINFNSDDPLEMYNFVKLLQVNCCEKNPVIECTQHFLLPSLLNTLKNNICSQNINIQVKTAKLIADMAQKEKTRHFLTDKDLIHNLISKFSIDQVVLETQICRALGNVCFENLKAMDMVVEFGGLKKAFELLKNRVEDKDQIQVIFLKAACIGLILNLLSDNSKIHKMVYDEGIINTLKKVLDYDLKKNEPTVASYNAYLVLLTLTESIDVENLFSFEVCQLAVNMFNKSFQHEICMTGLEFLEDDKVPDPVKSNLAKAGLFDIFLAKLEEKPESNDPEVNNRYELAGRVIGNILGGDDAMRYFYTKDNGALVNRLINFLKRSDTVLIYTAVLCLGNVARNDEITINLVGKEVHKLLMNVLAKHVDVKMQHAALSTLRNLSIAKANKKLLIDDGVAKFLVRIVEEEANIPPPILFKLVGTLRQLCNTDSDISKVLGVNEALVKRVIIWINDSVCPWVTSESCRFLCLLIINSKSPLVMQNILQYGGYVQIIGMLNSFQPLMQSECVKALILSCGESLLQLTNGNSISDVKKEDKNIDHLEKDVHEIKIGENIWSEGSGLIDTVVKKNITLASLDDILIEEDICGKLKSILIKIGPKLSEELIKDILALLEVVVKMCKVRTHLQDGNFLDGLRSSLENRSDFEQLKTSVEFLEIILNSCLEFPQLTHR